MKAKYAWPEGHWNWPIDICHKHGVRKGEMVWIGGQVDLTPEGQVCHYGDLEAQTVQVMQNIDAVLGDLGCGLSDLVTLLCFYVNDGSVDEAEFLELVAQSLPPGSRPTVNAIPVPWLAYDGMLVEIEGYAMRRENDDPMDMISAGDGAGQPIPPPFSQGLRSGRMIFVSAQYPVDNEGKIVHPEDVVGQTHVVMGRIRKILEEFGADFGDVVKVNRWYAGNVGIEDFEPAALACAGNFQEPGPAATGIPLPRHADPEVLIKISVVAMLGEDGESLERSHVWPDSLWDWHVHLPYKHGLKCEEMIFLGGQVSLDKQGVAVQPGDLSAQTHKAMEHIGTILEALGAGYDDVCKVTTVYRGDCGPDALNDNLPIRASYFSDPGPATTGVPLPALAYDGMMVEIDVFAMANPE